ncbi:MAG: alanine racemase [Puniceicoccaceae bacterium]
MSAPSPGSAPPGYRCWAEIDLSALEENVRRIRAAIPATMQYISVVKANAYGHGLAPLAIHLLQGGVSGFAVATLEEAETLRQLSRGCPILLLAALLPGEAPRASRLRITATLSSLPELHRIEDELARSDTHLNAHLEVDTGMGRLGVWHEQLAPLLHHLEQSPRLRLTGTFTHYADAPDAPDFTRLQKDRFQAVLPAITAIARQPLLIHADNSGGVETFGHDSPFNAARVGLLQFGVLQSTNRPLADLPVRPVLSLHARVAHTKELPPGSTISYGRTYTLQRRTRLAVLSAGYADGLPTQLSNCGRALLRGRICPILGRVTMDQTIIDASAIEDLAPGECATFIGTQGQTTLSVETFSQQANTIPWASLCGITNRVPRIYRHPRA